MRSLSLLLCALSFSFGAAAETYTSFSWVPYRQRNAGALTITQTANVWQANGGNLSFSATGIGSYIEDFMESTETFPVEGIRVEFDLTGTVGTSLGYVGPFVLLTADSGKGWNYGQPIGAQAFYRWEYQGTAGAVSRRGRIGNQDLGRVAFSGINGGAAAHHVFSVQRGAFTWTVNGATVSSGDMGTAPYSNMRLIVGARLYDSGRTQSASISNLKVTTASPTYTGPANVTVSGTVTDGSGIATAVGCTGNIQHRNPTSGGLVTISGAVGCSGAGNVYVNVAGTYDIATRIFTGTSTDASGGSSQAITFSPIGDTQWRGRLTGSTTSSTGARSYDLTVAFAMPADAYRASADLSDMRFTGTINKTQAISIPLVIPEINVNQSFPLNVIVTGSWEVQVVPGGSNGSWTLTGHSSGTFRGDRTVSATGSVTANGRTIPVPLSFDVGGSFGGTMSGSSAGNNLRFTGSWRSTAGDQSYGGDVTLTMPIDASSGRIPNIDTAIEGAMAPQISNLPARPVGISIGATAPVTVTPH